MDTMIDMKKAEQVTDPKTQQIKYVAHVESNDYYKNRIRKLELQVSSLQEENQKLINEANEAKYQMLEAVERATKLEKALIEASIR